VISFAEHGRGFHKDTLLQPSGLSSFVDHRALIGAPMLDGDMPPFVDGTSYIPKTGGVRNQTRGNACVAFFFAEAFDVGLVASGVVSESISSPRAVYRGARRYGNQLQGLPPTATILDVGTAPSYAVAAALQDGVPSEASDPYDDTKLVNDQETLAAAEDGAPKASLIINAYTPIVEPAGPALMRAIQQAMILPGTSVGIVLYAGPNFENADGTKIITAEASAQPNDHMVKLCGWFVVTAVNGTTCTLSNGVQVGFMKPPSVGDVVPLVRNSWGPQWAPGSPFLPGTCLVDPSLIASTSFQYAVKVSPK
jgi:hypothetical protein